ncbi:MAG: hypothetical protein U9Q66_02010, partial [Patescibacteria group bacterium]|nr:hypothetical protein [Patescibacteria group bacterium]
ASVNNKLLLESNIIFEDKVGSTEYKFSLVDGHVYKYSSVEYCWHWFAGCSKDRAYELIKQYLERKKSKYTTMLMLESGKKKK